MPTTSHRVSHKTWRDVYATGLICLTVAFLFADQNLLAPNLSTIAEEFNFSNEERDEKYVLYTVLSFVTKQLIGL